MTTPGIAAKVNFPSASLYVGDLSPEVNEALLFEIFNAVGPVASLRVCRDAITRKSLGYAYVNFHNASDAERALDTMNFSNIDNRPCRIMWSQRDPALRKSGVGNIFVKNLDKSIDHKALYDTFSVYGNILSCKVSTDQAGESLGYGFVHFQTAEAANKAVDADIVISGQTLSVAHFKPRAERSGDTTKFTNIYVKNLPENFDKNKLEALFAKAGPISSSMIAVSVKGNYRGCFAFVNYEIPEDAQEAIRLFHEYEYEGKNLFVCKAVKKTDRVAQLKAQYDERRESLYKQWDGKNLYVKNLSDTMDEEKLSEEFSKFGSMTSVKIMSDASSGRSKGFGFVCFENSEDAAKALQELSGKILDGKPLYVAFAQRRELRRQMLEKQRRDLGMVPAMYPPAGAVYPFPVPPPNRWGGPYVRGPMYPTPARGARGASSGRGARGGRGGRPGRGGREGGMPVQPMAPVQPAPASSFTDALSKASPQERKQMIGEKLFPLIREVESRRAGKITGMLLEMDDSDLLDLIESPEALKEKVHEAVLVLQEHETAAH
jgi:polyadenylate-binding protein